VCYRVASGMFRVLEAAPIPVTVLTGYLVAGRRTLLNRVLPRSTAAEYAVIVNEFGKDRNRQRLIVNGRRGSVPK